jgi:riboflavin synthase
MFTGLIQHVGAVQSITPLSDGGVRLAIDLGPLAAEAKAGDPIAVDGCCLTAARLAGALGFFDAVPETLRRTTLSLARAGVRVNLEASLSPQAKLGGHFVQGHIDGTAEVARTVAGGCWAEWHFKLHDPRLA